jgi:dephospho-CoA kinase
MILFIIYLIFCLIAITIICFISPRLDKKLPYLDFISKVAFLTVNLNFIAPTFKLHFSDLQLFIILMLVQAIAETLKNKLKVHGITGQTCAGKTLISTHMEESHKATIINLDNLRNEILLEPSVQVKVRKCLGSEVFDNEGELNQIKLQELVLSNNKYKKELDSTIVPRILSKLLKLVVREKIIKKAKHVLIEGSDLLQYPLLYWFCHPIIVVCSDKEMLIDRMLKRDGCTREWAEMILSKELSTEEFKAKSDIFFMNDRKLIDYCVLKLVIVSYNYFL